MSAKTLPQRQTSLVHSSSSTAVAAMAGNASRRNITEGKISNQSEYHVPPICTQLLSRDRYSTILHENETTRYSMKSMDMHVGITNLHDLQLPETSRSSLY